MGEHLETPRVAAYTLGSAVPGGLLVKQADIFTSVFMRAGIQRKKLTSDERFMYKRPHPTAQ